MSVSSVSTVVASSTKSFQNALEKGLDRARKTLRGIQAVEVSQERALVEMGEIKQYVVELKVIFILED
ncbi:MAG TPA: dodecin domain-containing protein [Porticoccaceae bacterium]|nr:dodecin domain-containing protein [Porticoccaceae bacterium]